jgi:hypothetical protein
MATNTHPYFVGVRLTQTGKAILDHLVHTENTSISSMIRECILRESVRPLFGQREVRVDVQN